MVVIDVGVVFVVVVVKLVATVFLDFSTLNDKKPENICNISCMFDTN